MTDHQMLARDKHPGFGKAIVAFESRLRGQLIRPQDPDYEAARRVYNGMIDRRPHLIARCVDVAAAAPAQIKDYRALDYVVITLP